VNSPSESAAGVSLPLHGSADAWAIAQLALKDAQTLLVLCENAGDAQRLADEIAWFAPAAKVHPFPDWETLPYDQLSPHQDLISDRLATLYELARGSIGVVLAPVSTALQRLPPREYLAAHTFFIKRGDRLDAGALREQLTLASYTHVTQVVRAGEYCIRGGLIDLFPMGSAVPYRIDLLDTDVESIKTFDADTQRTLFPVPEVRMLPAREFPFDDAARKRFRQNFRDKFEGDPSKSQLYKDVSAAIPAAGIEYFLPLFFDTSATLFDYLPQGARVLLHQRVHKAIEDFWRDTRARHRLLGGDLSRPILPPQELFLSEEAFFTGLRQFARIDLPPLPAGTGLDGGALAPLLESAARHATRALPDIGVDRRALDPLRKLRDFCAQHGGRTLLVAESLGRRETLLEFLRQSDFAPQIYAGLGDFLQDTQPLGLVAGPIAYGFDVPELALAVITETELYATQVRQTRQRDARRASSDTMLRDLAEVRAGDAVVHVQHGIGRFLGLVNLDLGEGQTEFMMLEYAGGDKLYVPVSQLSVISRYAGGPPEAAPLTKLGSGQWEKAKRKAAEQVRDTAAELLHLYAQRAARPGHAFDFKQHDYDTFAAGFEFEETPDQRSAIEAVLGDMRAGRAMDRLICGDVGFGKTEVAMRAAAVAVFAGAQVVILVPTTLLAEQHFLNFSDRFAEWPVKIAELSRFRSTKEQGAALQGLAEGKIDIVIGTHRLLQADVKLKNLGLVIIDEEHRFGVRQKERLKALRAEVDVLTLTATPIPRTLGMALEGLRDFSVIATSPQKRLAIKTFVHPYSVGLVREAVLRELKRGGQVFFLYNDVATMPPLFERLGELLPEARMAMAHGQLRERELERVMRDFYHQRYNLLLCSTIIETGIDVPTANTIIIDRADKFGLAQLHQLRGRVGRSHHQAYAYLLTPPDEALSAQAKKRLEAIQMMEELGSGFFLAMQDLEIRGAGEVLGESQSGEMQQVGFSLYVEMLNKAVRALKRGEQWNMSEPLNVTTEINLHAPALLPENYCSNVNERLVIYKRLANTEDLDQLVAFEEELIDRFGLPPAQVKTLIETHRLRLLGEPLGVAKIDAHSEAATIQFRPNPPVAAERIIDLIQQNSKTHKLAGPDKLKLLTPGKSALERAQALKTLFKQLS
jgi:transcription-repair coupling factor (superfamily II helicase)